MWYKALILIPVGPVSLSPTHLELQLAPPPLRLLLHLQPLLGRKVPVLRHHSSSTCITFGQTAQERHGVLPAGMLQPAAAWASGSRPAVTAAAVSKYSMLFDRQLGTGRRKCPAVTQKGGCAVPAAQAQQHTLSTLADGCGRAQRVAPCHTRASHTDGQLSCWVRRFFFLAAISHLRTQSTSPPGLGRSLTHVCPARLPAAANRTRALPATRVCPVVFRPPHIRIQSHTFQPVPHNARISPRGPRCRRRPRGPSSPATHICSRASLGPGRRLYPRPPPLPPAPRPPPAPGLS